MRLILLLSILLLASMPRDPIPLDPDRPEILIESPDCSVLTKQADALAEALGYSSEMNGCGRLGTTASLLGAKPPHVIGLPGLITYSLFNMPPISAPPITETFAIPGDIPFVAASGDIVAYTRLDMMLLSLRVDDLLQAAFALEKAGISRNDMSSDSVADGMLLVRVHPVTAEHLLKIERTAEKHWNGSEPLIASRIGFVQDCAGTMAALGAVALTEARQRAHVMANAAQQHIGKVLAVLDPGGKVNDAVCGVPKDATMRELAIAARDTPDFMALEGGTSHLYATYVRSITAAWRLNGPPNPPTTSLQFDQFTNQFAAPGQPVRGDTNENADPNRAIVRLPGWAYEAMSESPFGKKLLYFDVGRFSMWGVDVRGGSTSELKERVAHVRAYVLNLAHKNGTAPVDLAVRYSRDNCEIPIDTALYNATKEAIIAADGRRIRYLQMRSVTTIGLASCAYEPNLLDNWSSTFDAGQVSASASVVAAY